MTTWINCRDRLPEEDEDYTQYLLLMHNGQLVFHLFGGTEE